MIKELATTLDPSDNETKEMVFMKLLSIVENHIKNP